MSQAMTTQVNSERKKVTCEGVTNADIDLCMGAMKEAIDCMDAIATQGYEKDLHPCNEPDKVIGRVKRRIYWFRAEDFEMVAFLLQDLFCKLVRRIEATRTKWKYHGNKYCGLALIGGIG